MSSRWFLRALLSCLAVAAGAGAAAPGAPVSHEAQPAGLQATVKGRVLDALSGKGLPRAQIAPIDGPGAATTADDQGRFSLIIPADEKSILEARASGYLPARIAVSAGMLKTGRLPAVGLEPAAEVTGRVLGPGNQPLSGVAIEAVPESRLAARPFAPSERASDHGVSGKDGSFRLSALRPASHYELRARQDGSLPAAVSLVTAPPRGKTRAVELRLQPGRAAVGRVVDPEGHPLAGARVSLRPSRREGFRSIETHAEAPLSDGDPASAKTGPDGRFVAQCPAADLDVEVRLAGYAPVWRTDFHAGATPAPLDLGTLVLRPGARLGGKVVSEQGQPVAAAEVFLFDRLPSEASLAAALRERRPDAKTGADGRFELVDLPSGLPQHLFIRAEGFLPATVRGVRLPVSPPLQVRIEKGFALAGKVVDERERPVPRALVALVSQRPLEDDPYQRPLGRRISRAAYTDANGRFVIQDAPQGGARLSASAEGFVPLEGIETDVPAADPSRPLVLRLRAGAVVWGRVSTSAGDAVTDARVLTETGGGATDAEGFYRIAGVAEGRQQVAVRRPGSRTVSRAVQVEPGENRVDFELPAGVAVEGQVIDSLGDPVAGAEVRLRGETSRERQEYRSASDAAGRFRIEPVAAGAYRLLATAPGLAGGEAPRPVVVAAEPVSGLEVTLERGAMLSGRVLGVAPDELPFVNVEAHGSDGSTREARLDVEGMYQFSALAPGDWLVRATLWQGQKEARARVVIAPSDRELTRDLELGRKLTLSGQVLFQDEPLPDATLAVRGERFAIERTVITTFDGSFRLEDLDPDTYWLGVSKPDQLIAHNQQLDLREDRNLTIRLTGAKVSGRVRDAHKGDAIAGALIRLQPTEEPMFLIADSSHEDGSFHLLRIPPGSYRLQVSADGFTGAEQSVRVAAGEAVDGLDFALQPTSGGLLQVGLASGGVPSQVHLLALDAGGAPVLAETRPTEASGRVRLATLPPGVWQILVSAPGAATATGSVSVPGEPVALTLPPAGRLRLRVPALATTDLLATVRLLGPDQQALSVLGPGGQLQGTWSMTAGQATVDGVPPGSWLVQVEAPDGRVWTGSAATTGSGDTAVILE